MANGFFTDRAVATSPFRIGGLGSSAGLVSIAYGQVRVCTSADIGTTITPCPHLASVQDVNGNLLSVPAGGFGQITADVQGRFSFQAVPGSYQIQVAPAGSNTPQENYPVTVSNFALGTVAVQNGNNIFSGVNTTGTTGSFVGQLNGAIDFLTYFGAACDGITDDSAAWTAAMAFAGTNNGIRLLFPRNKTCFFSSTITINHPNVSLDCEAGFANNEHNAGSPFPSCQLLFAASNSADGIATTFNVGNISTSVQIQNLYIKGQATALGTGAGIRLTSSGPWVQHNVVQGFGGCGIALDSSGSNANVNFFHLMDNYLKFNKGDGICGIPGALVENVNVGWIVGNTVDSNGGWGINMQKNGSNQTFANIIELNHAVGNTSGGYQEQGGGNLYIENYAENDGKNTINIGGNNNFMIAGTSGSLITDSGTNNTIITSFCSDLQGSVANIPCIAPQWNIAPKAGTSGHIYGWFNANSSANSIDFIDQHSPTQVLERFDGSVPWLVYPTGMPVVHTGKGTACSNGGTGTFTICPNGSSNTVAQLSNNGDTFSNITRYSDHTLTLKKGSGAGNYTTASTTYVVVDSTNLCYTVTIPVGFKLGIQAQGSIGTSTAIVAANAAITDNAACATANAGILVEASIDAGVAGGTAGYALGTIITGDGNSHNIALQFKTANAADAALLLNSSTTLTPTIVFTLIPSN